MLLVPQASASLPVYGEIKEVTAYEFVDALNKTDSRVKVRPTPALVYK